MDMLVAIYTTHIKFLRRTVKLSREPIQCPGEVSHDHSCTADRALPAIEKKSSLAQAPENDGHGQGPSRVVHWVDGR